MIYRAERVGQEGENCPEPKLKEAPIICINLFEVLLCDVIRSQVNILPRTPHILSRWPGDLKHNTYIYYSTSLKLN